LPDREKTFGEILIAHLLNKIYQPRLVGADTTVYITDGAIRNLNSRYLSLVPGISLYPYLRHCGRFSAYVVIASPDLSGRGNLHPHPNPLPSRERNFIGGRTKTIDNFLDSGIIVSKSP